MLLCTLGLATADRQQAWLQPSALQSSQVTTEKLDATRRHRLVMERMQPTIVASPINMLGNGTPSANSTLVVHAAVTGSVFGGDKIHQYDGKLEFADWRPSAVPAAAPAAGDQKCNKWAVLTTIFEPSEAALQVTALPGWCFVVVADLQSPEEYPTGSNESGKVVYLTPDMQRSLAASETQLKGVELPQILPWKSFSRKNIGYLYAIAQGAQLVYDFDDDNVLVDAAYRPSAAFGTQGLPTLDEASTSVLEVDSSAPAVNLYPAMGGGEAWPRGFPLDSITEPAAFLASGQGSGNWLVENTTATRIGVLQSMVDGDPDVDAMYRLTRRELRFNFSDVLKSTLNRKAAAPVVALRRGTLMPFNAQATIHARDALWLALLPHSVHGRVADIWRSYISQVLMWQVGLRAAFALPWVHQERTTHDYLADFDAEQPLYSQASALVRVLREWKPKTASAPAQMEELYVELFERGFIGSNDVSLAQTWLRDLTRVGYRFPLTEAEHVAAATGRKPLSRV